MAVNVRPLNKLARALVECHIDFQRLARRNAHELLQYLTQFISHTSGTKQLAAVYDNIQPATIAGNSILEFTSPVQESLYRKSVRAFFSELSASLRAGHPHAQ